MIVCVYFHHELYVSLRFFLGKDVSYDLWRLVQKLLDITLKGYLLLIYITIYYNIEEKVLRLSSWTSFVTALTSEILFVGVI